MDFLTMKAEAKGIYWMLLLLLYANGGRLVFDAKKLSQLCNSRNFSRIWEKVLKKKFQIKSGKLAHKVVTRELRRAKRLLQTQSTAGLMGAKRRWGNGKLRYNDPIGDPISDLITKEEKEKKRREEKERTTNTSTIKQLSDTSIPFRVRLLKFRLTLGTIIRAKNQSDRTSFKNISDWLGHQVQQNVFDDKIFERVLNYAKEAVRAKGNSAAIWTSIIKKELGYDKTKKI